MRRSDGAALGAVAVAVAVFAACSGEDGGSVESADESSPLAEYVSTTAPYSGVGFGTPFGQGTEVPWASDEQREQQRRFENAVAECMAEEGFEYVPALEDGRLRAYEEAAALSTEEFVEEHGYGFTLGYLETGDESSADPNRAIRDALSPEAREAYDAAMWGDGVEVIDAGGTTVLSERPSDGASPSKEDSDGCQQRANEEVYGEPSRSVGDIPFQALREDIFQLYRRVEDDPQVVEAARAWADCMADGGYPGFDTVAEARRSILERLNEVVMGPGAAAAGDGGGAASDEGGAAGDGDAAGDEDSAAGDGGSTAGDGDSAAGGVATGDAPGAVDAEELRQLHEDELAQAAVDHACQQEHYVDIYREVAHELEAEFVEQHRDELESYRSYLQGES